MARPKAKKMDMVFENEKLKDRIRRLEHLLELKNAEYLRAKDRLNHEIRTQNAILKAAGKEISITPEDVRNAEEYVVVPVYDEEHDRVERFTFIPKPKTVTIEEEED